MQNEEEFTKRQLKNLLESTIELEDRLNSLIKIRD